MEFIGFNLVFICSKFTDDLAFKLGYLYNAEDTDFPTCSGSRKKRIASL